MGNTHEAIAEKLRAIAGYRALFAKAFGIEETTIDRTAKAIACFERTVLSGNAPYYRYKKGDKRAMTPEQVRGMSVFIGKAKCDQCHEGANFTLNAYANLGVGADKPDPDVGRYAVTKDSAALVLKTRSNVGRTCSPCAASLAASTWTRRWFTSAAARRATPTTTASTPRVIPKIVIFSSLSGLTF